MIKNRDQKLQKRVCSFVNLSRGKYFIKNCSINLRLQVLDQMFLATVVKLRLKLLPNIIA